MSGRGPGLEFHGPPWGCSKSWPLMAPSTRIRLKDSSRTFIRTWNRLRRHKAVEHTTLRDFSFQIASQSSATSAKLTYKNRSGTAGIEEHRDCASHCRTFQTTLALFNHAPHLSRVNFHFGQRSPRACASTLRCRTLQTPEACSADDDFQVIKIVM